MVNKTTTVEQPAIRTDTELTLVTDESNSEESNSNNSNSDSSPQGAMVGLNSNSDEDEKSLSSEEPPEPSAAAPVEDEGEIDISFGYEGYNYTSYMKARSHYDKKDELFTKGSNYTTKCRRQPYIVSKSHFERNINKLESTQYIKGVRPSND